MIVFNQEIWIYLSYVLILGAIYFEGFIFNNNVIVIIFPQFQIFQIFLDHKILLEFYMIA